MARASFWPNCVGGGRASILVRRRSATQTYGTAPRMKSVTTRAALVSAIT